MKRLYSIKDEKSELYAQIEASKDIWQFLDKLSNELYGENWMIDDHYRGRIKNNDYFGFKKKDIYLGIIIAEKRVHIVILGLTNHSKIKDLILKNYSFEQ